MEQADNQKPKGDGTDFLKDQSDLAKAKNERVKAGSEPNNDEEDVTLKTDVSRKKTGGGKQVNPGA